MIKRFVQFCDFLSWAGGILSGFLTVVALILIIAEIGVRTFFHGTLYITEEYSGYLMAAITFFGLSFTLKEKAHIRMMFLFSILKGNRRRILEVYAYLVGVVFTGILSWTTFQFFWDSVVSKSRSMQLSETYLAIPQAVLPLGSALLCLQFLAEAVRTWVAPAEDKLAVKVESATLGR